MDFSYFLCKSQTFLYLNMLGVSDVSAVLLVFLHEFLCKLYV